MSNYRYDTPEQEVNIYREIFTETIEEARKFLEGPKPDPDKWFSNPFSRLVSWYRSHWQGAWAEYLEMEPHKEPIYRMFPRGLGSNWIPCLICNEGDLNTDFASFVNSKEDGEAIVGIFTKLGLHAKLDYRDFEPNWIQVKIAACKKHLLTLKLLEARIESACCHISEADIKYCLPEAENEN